jgi:hypothetical protein
MTLDYRKFKKINLKVGCFFLPFFLQTEARVLMQWNVIAIFLNEKFTMLTVRTHCSVLQWNQCWTT